MSERCPWLKGGYCASPQLEHPDNTIVGKHCVTSYKSCRFYVEPQEKEEKEGLEKFMPHAQLRFWKVNLITDRELMRKVYDVSCDYFRYQITDNGMLTFCLVKQRLMAASEGANCILYAAKCPLRRIAEEYFHLRVSRL